MMKSVFGSRPTLLTLMAIAVLVTAACGQVETRPSPGGTDYFVSFAAEAASPGDDPNGGAVITMSTNLPDGTMTAVETTHVGGQGGLGFQCCPAFDHGTLEFHQFGDCLTPVGTPPSRGFRLTVTVVPDLAPLQPECLQTSGCSIPQPDEVQEILGKDFERLEGDQVSTVHGMRALVASTEYDWPTDACSTAMRSGLFMPDRCAAGGMTIDEDDVRLVGGSVVGALNQLRLCELWNNGTATFKDEHPWPEFRDRVKQWIDDRLATTPLGDNLHGKIASKSRETVGPKEVPAWIEVDYVYREQTVGRARFLARPHPHPNAITRWEIAELVLLDAPN